MRNNLFMMTYLYGLVAARPQEIDISSAKAVPTPSAALGPEMEDPVPNAITYNLTTTTVSSEGCHSTAFAVPIADVEDDCALQPGGAGPIPGNGSISDYLDVNNTLRGAARAAGTPIGYQKEFTDLTNSTQQIGYLTYKNIENGTYNVEECAAFCDSEKFCLGFNIYYERDPKNKPASTCTNPQPITNVKCAIYGYPVANLTATNAGQFREEFQVVIVGSNGYSRISPNCKPAPAVENFNAPVNLKAAINAPLITKNNGSYDTYNGMRLYNEGPFDPAQCGKACEAQTDFDKEHLVDSNGEYKPCNYFTSYILTENEIPLGTYCAFYTQPWNESYAVNTGYTNGSDVYSVICAASYTATNQDPGKLGA